MKATTRRFLRVGWLLPRHPVKYPAAYRVRALRTELYVWRIVNLATGRVRG